MVLVLNAITDIYTSSRTINNHLDQKQLEFSNKAVLFKKIKKN